MAHRRARLNVVRSSAAGRTGGRRRLAGGARLSEQLGDQPGDRRTSGSAGIGPRAWPGSRIGARDRTARRVRHPPHEVERILAARAELALGPGSPRTAAWAIRARRSRRSCVAAACTGCRHRPADRTARPPLRGLPPGRARPPGPQEARPDPRWRRAWRVLGRAHAPAQPSGPRSATTTSRWSSTIAADDAVVVQVAGRERCQRGAALAVALGRVRRRAGSRSNGS